MKNLILIVLFTLLSSCSTNLQKNYSGRSIAAVSSSRNCRSVVGLFLETRAYRITNEKMSNKYTNLKEVLEDPKKFMDDLKGKFAKQKLLTPNDPYRFDFSDYGLPVVKQLSDQISEKEEAFIKRLELLENTKASKYAPNWAKKIFPNLVGKRKAIRDQKLALKYLREVDTELKSYLKNGSIDYRSLQEVGYFYSRIVGVFDAKKLNVRDRIMLAIDRHLQGYKVISVSEEYDLYKKRQFTVFQKESPVDGFQESHHSFDDAFFNKDKFEMASLPIADHLGPDIFMRLLAHDIYLQGISLNPAAADGFVRPGGDFWLHDIRHSSAIFHKKKEYEQLHSITEEQAEVLSHKMDKWKIELDEERRSVPSKELRYAIGFFMFNHHHDRGVPMVPSSYLKENLDHVPYLLYAMLKISNQPLGFKNPHKTMTEAYAWLRDFWLKRLTEEYGVFNQKTVKEFTTDPFSITEGHQLMVASSGVEVDGNVKKIIRNTDDRIIYYNTEGPTKLTYFQKGIEGQGVNQHPHGFGSPVGKVQGIDKPFENLSSRELKELGIVVDSKVRINYESGVRIEGVLSKIQRRNGKIIIMSFEKATVTGPGGETLFKPAWGTYDMAVVDEFVGAFEKK